MIEETKSGDENQSTTDTSANSVPRSVWLKFWEALVGFLPSPLDKIIPDLIKKNLLKAFLFLLLMLLVFPPSVVLLAAFWLKLMGNTNINFLKAIRNDCLELIHDGFSIEEASSRSNIRLDYYQLFEYDLHPKSAPYKTLMISILPSQKAIIDFKVVNFTADIPNCTIPESNIDLVSLSLGDQLIRTLRQDWKFQVEIGKDWWQQHLKNFNSHTDFQHLSFALTENVTKFKCGRVHVEGSIRVYKDMYEKFVPSG